MTSPGWLAAVGCAVLVLLVDAAIWGMVRAASDGLGRNHVAGIRLPSLLRSDEAWRAGHGAAAATMRPVLCIAAVLVLVSIPAQVVPVLYVILLGLSLLGTVAALGVGTLSASRAARRVERLASPMTSAEE
jgi:hypothetical protein